MSFIMEIYNILFYQPIYQILFFFYKMFKDFGFSIIVFAFLLKIILFPLEWKNNKEQEKFLKMKKEMDEINKKFKGEQRAKEILKVYQREKVNPLFSFVFLLVQLPIWISLYRIFLNLKTQNFEANFLGFFNLAETNLFLPFLAVLFQLFYFKLTLKKIRNDIFAKMNFIFLPFIFLILISLPSAMSLYFLVNYLLLIVQKYIFHV